MRRVLTLILATLIVITLFPTVALATREGDYNYEIVDGDSIRITKYNGSTNTNVKIPDRINNMPVTEIGNDAFNKGWREGHYEIKSVIIPDTVTWIHDWAFRWCSNLQSVVLPASLNQIGNAAFASCSSLTTLSPAGVAPEFGKAIFPKPLLQIGSEAFKYTAIQSIEFLGSVQQIYSDAFSTCESLVEANIPGSVKVINPRIFQYCSSLETVTLNDGTTTIEEDMLGGCPSMVKLVIPSTVTNISINMFHSYEELGSWQGNAHIPKNLVISCKENSYAHSFALKYGIACDVPLTPPPAPNGLSASVNKDSVSLKWDAVPNVNGYDVYRSTDNQNYTSIGATTNTYKTDNSLSSGTTYYYKVYSYKVVGGVNKYGEASATVSAVIPGAAPATVSGLKVAAVGTDSVTLTWNGVSGAEGYDIALSANGSSFPDSGIRQTTETSYKYGGLKPGTRYYFKVRAYGAGGSLGQYSGVVSADTKKQAVATVAAPSNIKISGVTTNKAVISWAPVAGAKGYELQCSINGGAYKKLKDTGAKAYTHTGLKLGTKYSYKVRAYRMSGGRKVYGAFSKVVSVTPKFPAVKGVKATSVKAGEVKLTWSLVSGAAAYEVEVSTNGKTFKKAPGGDNRTRSYTKAGLDKGKTYYYRVRAYKVVNGKKAYGAYSAVAKVKIK